MDVQEDVSENNEDIIEHHEYVDDAEISIVQGEQVVGLDFMNLRVIRCDGDVAQEVTAIDGGEVDVGDVVVQMEDGQETQYVLHHTTEINEDGTTSIVVPADQVSEMNQYVSVVENESGPLVFFTSKPGVSSHDELVERRRRRILVSAPPRRKEKFVISEEMMDSPKFKLFLYSCKQCEFKCNAIKELTAHRLNKHSNSNMGRFRSGGRPPIATVQQQHSTPTEALHADIIYGINMNYCSVCSYSSISSQQVRRHINKIHRTNEDGEEEENVREKSHRLAKLHDRGPSNSVNLSVNYYFCDDCGFGASSKNSYKRHECSRSNK